MLLSIPLPILLKANIKPQGQCRYITQRDAALMDRKRLMIAALLCSGLFVFVVSIILLVLTLGDINHMNALAIWAFREMVRPTHPIDAQSLTTKHAPCVKLLFSSSSWMRGSGNSYDKKRTPNGGRGDIVLRKVNKDLYPITNLSVHASTSRSSDRALKAATKNARQQTNRRCKFNGLPSLKLRAGIQLMKQSTGNNDERTWSD
ncbi:hypothetical protein BU25DRAFT_211260 [Macroventuria anomochaeta]|uniref:Uncharacterized protein n=1 Tax=Macroventuria anomochaeta TaxID=301207 RepID=A0ACB6RLZ6_9PLEO|nr:uncharacterized protein BU25DRAFT_211260 [Macroventuria anomochaeta]KAF2622347.1 hypothetical protein BU25DRAFT_211260 [Macroventuria anomochaeta]